MLISLSLLLGSLATPAASPLPSQAATERTSPIENDWTILVYAANANSSEESFVEDLADLRRALARVPSVEVVVLADRSSAYSSAPGGFEEDFSDTRLYAFRGKDGARVAGGESFPEITLDSHYDANTGDAETLRKFLRFAKAQHPARRYALVFYSHGQGWSFCPDEESDGDALHPAELSDHLDEQDSVDLLVFDVCSMAAVENGYQWRPGRAEFSAEVLVATPNAGFPFPWFRILSRIHKGQEADGAVGQRDASHEALERFDAATLEALDFGRLIVEESRLFKQRMIDEHPRYASELEREAMGCFDLKQAGELKRAVDGLAVALAQDDSKRALEELRGPAGAPRAMNYLLDEPGCWTTMPYFDIYDLARGIRASEEFDEGVRAAAKELKQAVDAYVVSSFGLGAYENFVPGQNGAYLVFPDGDAEQAGERHWKRLDWYRPARSAEGERGYGRYAWCADGAEAGNERVENWFELLDAWFDTPDESGGLNGYSF